MTNYQLPIINDQLICEICGQPKLRKQQAERSAKIREIREIRGQTPLRSNPPKGQSQCSMNNNQWSINLWTT